MPNLPIYFIFSEKIIFRKILKYAINKKASIEGIIYEKFLNEQIDRRSIATAKYLML